MKYKMMFMPWALMLGLTPGANADEHRVLYPESVEIRVFYEQGKTIFNTSMSDNGSEHYFTDSNPDTREDGAPTALWVRTADGAAPVPTPGIGIPADVHITPNGETLYFTEFAAEHSYILSMKRANGGWSAPEKVTELEMEGGASYVTSTRSGERVFSSAGDIYFLGDGEPEKLPRAINSDEGEYDPFIAQDGSFLIFVRQQPDIGDSNMFISFRTPAGWTNAEKLPSPFNLDKVDGSPYVTPDGRYLFFSSNRAGDGVLRTYQAPFGAWLAKTRQEHLEGGLR